MQSVAKLSADSERTYSVIGKFIFTKLGVYNLIQSSNWLNEIFLHKKRNNWETCGRRITSTKICSCFHNL